ncbi:MAG: 2OG-Fe(II) oxygenase [Proteobacteria bacterium]|nr:MAG: 2OG-Fe(II) oxygenase [Pseudomonadota bacterium]
MNSQLARQMPKLIDDLTSKGWAALPLAFSRSECLALIETLESRYSADEFHIAKIGRGANEISRQDVRSDSTLWLEKDDAQASVQAWLLAIDEVRVSLNQALFIAAVDFNSHFSCYEIDGFYQKHLDKFQGKSTRVLSIILYLNEGWITGDHGELLIYEQLNSQKLEASIKPEMGTLVIFDSETVTHEVRRTNRRRLSVTGWLTRWGGDPIHSPSN